MKIISKILAYICHPLPVPISNPNPHQQALNKIWIINLSSSSGVWPYLCLDMSTLSILCYLILPVSQIWVHSQLVSCVYFCITRWLVWCRLLVKGCVYWASTSVCHTIARTAMNILYNLTHCMVGWLWCAKFRGIFRGWSKSIWASAVCGCKISPRHMQHWRMFLLRVLSILIKMDIIIQICFQPNIMKVFIIIWLWPLTVLIFLSVLTFLLLWERSYFLSHFGPVH